MLSNYAPVDLSKESRGLCRHDELLQPTHGVTNCYRCPSCDAHWLLRDVISPTTGRLPELHELGYERHIVKVLRAPTAAGGILPAVIWPAVYRSLRDVPHYRKDRLPSNPLFLVAGLSATKTIVILYVLIPMNAAAVPPQGGWGWLENA